MRKFVKTRFSIALAIIIMLAAFPVSVDAVEPSNVTAAAVSQSSALPLENYLSYENYGDGITITDCISSYPGDLIIPATIDGFTVTKIGRDAFDYCNGITSVVIPESVIEIVYGAFSNCTSLSDISLPGSLKTIGANSFSNTQWYNIQPAGMVYLENIAYQYKGAMPSNTSISINAGTVAIAESAFNSCSNLTSVIIPNSVTNIVYGAFSNCTALTEVNLTGSVTTIGASAFNGCSNLANITIPDSVTSIGSYAFHNTKWFNDKPNGLVYAGKVAYAYKGAMPADTAITLNEGTVGIAGCAFSSLTGLKSITIPSSVTSIVYGAFSNCTSLTGLSLPVNLKSIGEYAFAGCTKITSLNIPEGVTNIVYGAFSNCSALTNISIPNSVTRIVYGAFSNCSSLKSVTIPENVTSIGDSVFTGCSSLKIINFNAINCEPNYSVKHNISSTMSSYGQHYDNIYFSALFVFYLNETISYSKIFGNNNNSLTSVNLGGNVKIIPNFAFYGCSALTSITIPESVMTIGGASFFGCSSLSMVNYNPINCDTELSLISNTVYVGDIIKQIYFSGDFVDYSSYIINYGGMAHKYDKGYIWGETNNSLVAVNFGQNVLNIPDFAFYNCAGITDISIPACTKNIGQYAFYGCAGITEISIPNGVKNIEQAVFNGCAGLTCITIPESVTNIVYNSFGYCTALEVINYNAIKCDGYFYSSSPWGNSNIKTINIGSSVEKIPDYLFSTLNSITSITIPESITNVGYNAFSGCIMLNTLNFNAQNCIYMMSSFQSCNSLVTVNIGNSVNGIPENAFYGCGSLMNIDIPDSVNFIGKNALNGTGWYNNQPNGIVYAGKVAYAYKGIMPVGTTISLLAGTKSISDYAFVNCEGLANIYLPASLVDIGYYAFLGCTGQTNIDVDSGNLKYSSFEGILYNKAKTALLLCPEGKTGSLTLPIGTKVIAVGAFQNNNGLTSVIMNDGLRNIGACAFYSCKNLVTVSIPSTVTFIGETAFIDCVQMSQMIIKSIYTDFDNYCIEKTPNIKIFCYADSDAEMYALQRSIPYEIIESTAVSGVNIDLPSVTLAVSETKQLNANIAPLYATNKNITWGSTNNTVATVSSTGLVTAKTIGTATITAITLDGGFVATCDVAVVSNKIAVSQGSSLNLNANTGIITNMNLANASVAQIRSQIGNSNIRFVDFSGDLIADSARAGTGTRLQLLSSDGTVLDELTIVVFGDANGDANIDSIDAGIIIDYENYVLSWDPTIDEAFIKAGDLNGDGSIDSLDAGIAVDAENYLVIIDQITGLATQN